METFWGPQPTCRESKPRDPAHSLETIAERPANFLCSRTDLDKLALELSVTLPHIYSTADYDVTGRILGNIKGKGAFTGNFSEYIFPTQFTFHKFP